MKAYQAFLAAVLTIIAMAIVAYAQSGPFNTEIGASNPSGIYWVNSAQSGSFAALPGYVYFCSATLTCTLPDATANAGRSLLIVNTGAAATITYAFVGGQTLNGSSSVTNAAQFQEDLITSNGANWFKK